MDFYEGEILYGVKIKYSPKPSTEQAMSIAKTLDDVVYSEGRSDIHADVFATIIKNIKFLPKGVRLKPVDDSKDILIPAACGVEQLALYTPDGIVHIVGDFWEKMSETDKAGLVSHEALFRMERFAGQSDSIRARMINAYAFSKYPFVPV